MTLHKNIITCSPLSLCGILGWPVALVAVSFVSPHVKGGLDCPHRLLC